MDADKKKQLRSDYKNKAAVGAVYALVCSGNGRRLIKSTVDIAGIQNRFQFSQMTKSCPDPALRSEWVQFGSEAFSLEVLEEIKRNEEQTPAEFAEDVKLLHKMWTEKQVSGRDE